MIHCKTTPLKNRHTSQTYIPEIFPKYRSKQLFLTPHLSSSHYLIMFQLLPLILQLLCSINHQKPVAKAFSDKQEK